MGTPKVGPVLALIFQMKVLSKLIGLRAWDCFIYFKFLFFSETGSPVVQADLELAL